MNRVLKRRFFALTTFCTFAAIAACQLVAGIDRVDETDPPVVPQDAAPPEAAPPPPDLCAHASPPPPPESDDNPDEAAQLSPFFVAFREVHLLGDSDGGAFGYDLDGVCTCDSRPGAAFDGGSSCVSLVGSKTCDQDAGIDNQQAELLTTYASFVPNANVDEAAGVNGRIATGTQGILVQISGYNGLANDKSVSVGFIISHGILDSSGCGADASIEAGPYPPGWCGQDKWSVDPSSVLGGPGLYAPTVAAAGYVTNHVLVVADTSGLFQVPFGDSTVMLESPTIVATIVPLDSAGNPRDAAAPPSSLGDGNFRLASGVLAGRVPATSMLAFTGALINPGGKEGGAPTYLCESPTFAILKPQLCNALDITSRKTLDFDPKATCDSMSTATTFLADPAQAGQIAAGNELNANPCVPDAGGDATLPGLATLYTCP